MQMAQSTGTAILFQLILVSLNWTAAYVSKK